MSIATVVSGGIGNTLIYDTAGGPQTKTISGGQSAVISSPADVVAQPGGQAAIMTNDGSTIGLDPIIALTFFAAGGCPALNAWDCLVTDPISGWEFRLSSLSLPLSGGAVVGAPNATDGLIIKAPDGTTQVISVTPEQNVQISAQWRDAGAGLMQISQLTVTVQDVLQYTWTLTAPWVVVFPAVL